MDLIEINEAFAAQYLACEEELGLDREKVNVNGGAVAFGHPVGASGARVLLTVLYELTQREKKYGLASLCIGGGQAYSDGRRSRLRKSPCSSAAMRGDGELLPRRHRV